MGDGEFVIPGVVVEWRGPAPFVFVELPEEESGDLKLAAAGLEYWGQVPVVARVRGVEFFTALFPRDGRYLVPLKLAVRTRVPVALGDAVEVALRVQRDRPPGVL